MLNRERGAKINQTNIIDTCEHGNVLGLPEEPESFLLVLRVFFSFFGPNVAPLVFWSCLVVVSFPLFLLPPLTPRTLSL